VLARTSTRKIPTRSFAACNSHFTHARLVPPSHALSLFLISHFRCCNFCTFANYTFPTTTTTNFDSANYLLQSTIPQITNTLKDGSGTFRSLVFSLLGVKVPPLPLGTFAPGSVSSRELSFQGTNVPGSFVLRSDIPGNELYE